MNLQSLSTELDEEFADALVSLGLMVDENQIIMNGSKRRVPVEGDKKGQLSGLYIGYLDGHPAGFIKNFKTGAEMKWKSKGRSLDPLQKARLQTEVKEKIKTREIQQTQLQEQVAHRVSHQLAGLIPVKKPTRYMTVKGIAPHSGAFTDEQGLLTYLPAIDTDRKQWTMQYILEDGTKRFTKDSKKQGCFHAVGGMDSLAQAPVLVIAEGYATAASLSEALGFSTVAAFDSGNLVQVASALKKKFPVKLIVIAGDDNRHLELTQGVNPGKVKAKEAAKAAGGKVVLPIFASGENSYPADLTLITPELFREHLHTGSTLSDKQLGALQQIKAMTDFNDLATKSAIGRAGMREQVNRIIDTFLQKDLHERGNVEKLTAHLNDCAWKMADA